MFALDQRVAPKSTFWEARRGSLTMPLMGSDAHFYISE